MTLTPDPTSPVPKPLPVLDHAATLADPTRVRLLYLLEQSELTVGELQTVLGLPQSTVSRHLRVLGDGRWVVARSEGTHRYYTTPGPDQEATAAGLWRLVRAELERTDALADDKRRLEPVLAARRARSQQFFAETASQWDALRDELYGRAFDCLALPGLLDPMWRVGDLGCGTGRVAAALAPFVAQVIAVDASGPMLQAAEARLAALPNVDVRSGALEALPIDTGILDAVVLVLALHHVAEPARALLEAERVLRPGGRLLVVDTQPHDREELQQQLGHVWLGFSHEQLSLLLREAGFEAVRYRPLGIDAAAKGPPLFAATAATFPNVDSNPDSPGRKTSPSPARRQ